MNAIKNFGNRVYCAMSSFGHGIHSMSCGCSELGALLVLMILVPIFLICYLIYGCIFGFEVIPKSSPQSIEQIREKRDEKYNAAGKSVHEFLRGSAGLDKSK